MSLISGGIVSPRKRGSSVVGADRRDDGQRSLPRASGDPGHRAQFPGPPRSRGNERSRTSAPSPQPCPTPKQTDDDSDRIVSTIPGVPAHAFVYFLASRRNGTLYVGVTTHIARRLQQHRSGEVPGFTTKYSVHRLVYFERFDTLRDAQARERQVKKWNRVWKVELLERVNPTWRDLAGEIPM